MVKRKSQPRKSQTAATREDEAAGAATTSSNKTRKSLVKSVKPSTRALQEIKRLQKTTDLLIPRAPFLRVVREIIYREGEYRLTEMAAEALREATESYVVGVLEDAYQLSIHAKRVTLFPRDIQLVIQLRRDLVALSVG